MHGTRLQNGLLLAVAVWTLGCTSSPWSKKETVSTTPPPAPTSGPPSTAAPTPPVPAASGAVQPASATVPAGPAASSPTSAGVPAEGQSMEAILAEIRQSQSLDARSEEELARNLRATPPSLWPLVVQQFRAALAYRRQAQQHENGPPSEVASASSSSRPQAVEDQAAAYHRQPEARDTASADTDSRSVKDSASVKEAIGPVARHNDQRPATRVAILPETDDAPRERDRDTERPLRKRGKVAKAPPPEEDEEEETDEEPVAKRAVVARTEPRVGADWHVQLDDTIRSLESQVQLSPRSTEEIADHARLRMLYLAGGRRDDALRPIPSLSNSMQEFWSKEFCGLATMLDTERAADPSRRAAEAQRHLSEAVVRLREEAPLLVRNLSFVTDVQSYGSFKPFDRYDFRPGQRVLLYAEVENYKIKESNRGYHTALRSEYQIFDSHGQRVTEHDFGTNEEHCQNPRRDFFIGYEFGLPKSIPAGKYTLQLTVTDLNGDKIGQSSVDFTIVGRDDVARAK